MPMILLREYAKLHGKTGDAMRIKANRGNFETAKKYGREWYIDSDEPLIDKRTTRTHRKRK
jgi:hypothetical protein